MRNIAVVGILLSAAMTMGGSRPAAEKPNILFILVDDYGIKDVGVEGSTFYETPHIDSLARSGMRFTQGYAACPVCSPSRASILLGKYPPRHGITDWIGAAVGEAFAKQRHVKLLPPDYVRNLPAADTTLAEALKQAGYATFFAGKWHLGSKGSWPEDHGFDINKGGWDAGSPDGRLLCPVAEPQSAQRSAGRIADPASGRAKPSPSSSSTRTSRFWPTCRFTRCMGRSRPPSRSGASIAKRPPSARAAERFKIDRTLPVRQVQDNPDLRRTDRGNGHGRGPGVEATGRTGVGRPNTIVFFTSDNGGVSSGDSFSSSAIALSRRQGPAVGRRPARAALHPGARRHPARQHLRHAGDRHRFLSHASRNWPACRLRPKQHVDGVSLVPLAERREDRRRVRSSGTIRITATRAANLRRSSARATGSSSIIGRTTATSFTICPTTSASSTTWRRRKRRAPPTLGGAAGLAQGNRRQDPAAQSRNTQAAWARAAAAKAAQALKDPARKARMPPTSIPTGSPIPRGGRASCPQIETVGWVSAPVHFTIAQHGGKFASGYC